MAGFGIYLQKPSLAAEIKRSRLGLETWQVHKQTCQVKSISEKGLSVDTVLAGLYN